MVALRLPGTRSESTRTPDGSRLRRTSASPAARNESSAAPSGSSTAPFIRTSLCHGPAARQPDMPGRASARGAVELDELAPVQLDGGGLEQRIDLLRAVDADDGGD